MPLNELPASKGTPVGEAEQESVGKGALLQARTDEDTATEVARALRREGHPSTAEGIRRVLLCYARSKKVQRAVRQTLALAMLAPKAASGAPERAGPAGRR